MTYDFYAKVLLTNNSTYDTYSIVCINSLGENVVVRLKKGQEVKINNIYHFKGEDMDFKGKNHIRVLEYVLLDDESLSDDEKLSIKLGFTGSPKVNVKEYALDIESTIDSFENKVIKDITSYIYNKYKERFIKYPAASRFHHAYEGGLIFHTHTMLELSRAFVKNYPHINSDLVYSGIILHDIMKTEELGGVGSSEYTLKGKFLGHISMIEAEIVLTAEKLGYKDTDEALLLEHIVLSHHEEPEFGSPRRPLILEALIVHLCDVFDARVEPTIEALEKVKVGEFSEQIPVNNKQRYYKHKLSK